MDYGGGGVVIAGDCGCLARFRYVNIREGLILITMLLSLDLHSRIEQHAKTFYSELEN